LFHKTALLTVQLKNEIKLKKQESNKLLIYDKQANVESVINTNLAKIENSKELLKNILMHLFIQSK
jgi:hypothetical protein